MNIRAQLTATFILLVTVVLSVVSVAIYFFSANYRKDDFQRRLKNRAVNTAKILTEVAEVNADLLRRMEQNNPASLPNQYIAIYDSTYVELYTSESMSLVPIDTAIINRTRQKRELVYQWNDYEILGFVFQHAHKNYIIIAAATDAYGNDALKNLRRILLITFCASIVVVSVLGWIYAGRVLRPIKRIVAEVGSITEANLNQRLDEGKNEDELSLLAKTFNTMLTRLQSSFSSQKNFIANASHEIKTPITVMSGEIEVTLLQNRSEQYYINVLQSVLSGLRNLNRLSSQLLLLAQTSAEGQDNNFTLVRIDDILWDVKDELSRAHPDYVIHIFFDLSLNDQSLALQADEQLIKVALLNLVDNACKYAETKEAYITLKAEGNHEAVIEFTNAGAGISDHDLPHIFSPFYRGSGGKKIKGFGIGLSLVQKIIELHKGTITVQSVPFEQTIFRITLPMTAMDVPLPADGSQVIG